MNAENGPGEHGRVIGKRKGKKVELLAPAKNLKCIKAGLPHADAFYFGTKKFNMRMQADNFSWEDLKKAVKLCHKEGKKAYFVSNILIYENELEDLRKTLEDAYSLEFDAAIVNDLAALEICKELGFPFHISTQQNVSNSRAARFFERLGAERIIPARECTLKQIAEIASRLTKTEIEAFVHGAMCTMVSGRCYFSMTFCRENSANRGLCLQPCRREWIVYDLEGHEYIYDGVRFFNSRDLCMIEYIPEMIEAGIAAFKIEGRMRSPHYVEVVSKIYREAIDAYYRGEFTTERKKKVGKWIYELKKEYNRGFTHGFYFKRATEEDHQHKSPTNLSHWRMIKMGTVVGYDTRKKMAKIKLTNGFIKEKLDLIVQGDKNSDTYFHQSVGKIIYRGKRVSRSPKGTPEKPITVYINMDRRVYTDGRDAVYIFTDKTYENRIKMSASGRRKGESFDRDAYYRL